MKPCELEKLVSKVDEAKKKRRAHLDKIIQAAGKELRSRILKNSLNPSIR